MKIGLKKLSLSFPSSQMVFILPSFLKGIFDGLTILLAHNFFNPLLAAIVSDEKSAVIYILVLLYVICCIQDFSMLLSSFFLYL